MDEEDDLSDFVTTYVTSDVRGAFRKQMLLGPSRPDPKNSALSTWDVIKISQKEEDEKATGNERDDARKEFIAIAATELEYLDRSSAPTESYFASKDEVSCLAPDPQSKKLEQKQDEPSDARKESIAITTTMDKYFDSGDDIFCLVPDPGPKSRIHAGMLDYASPSPTLEKYFDSDGDEIFCMVPDPKPEETNPSAGQDRVATNKYFDSGDELCYLIPDSQLNNKRQPSPDIEEIKIVPVTRGRYFTRSQNRQKAPLKRKATTSGGPKVKKPKRRVLKSADVIEIPDDEPPIVPIISHVEVEDEFNYETNVKVLWQSSKIVKIPVRRLQKLEVVFNFLVKTEGVAMDCIVLNLNGSTVKMTDTPHSLDLKITDFLDGGVINANSFRPSTGNKTPSISTRKFDLKIKFQCADKKCITLGASRDDKMHILMVAFAEQIDKPLGSLKFMFDGVVVSPQDTPQALDIENNEVIDVICN